MKSWGTYYEEDIKYFKESDVIKFLDGITNSFHEMLFTFIFETGARIGEVLNVRLSYINFEDRTIKLFTSKRRSKNVVGVITLSDSLLNKILLHEKNKGLKTADYLFCKKTGSNPISAQAVNQAMKKLVVKISGKEYRELAHPHTLRHSRAVQLLNSDVNIMHVKSILGHANIMNTLVYLKYANKDLQESIKRTNRQFGRM